MVISQVAGSFVGEHVSELDQLFRRSCWDQALNLESSRKHKLLISMQDFAPVISSHLAVILFHSKPLVADEHELLPSLKVIDDEVIQVPSAEFALS